jgi:hypothetical protein
VKLKGIAQKSESIPFLLLPAYDCLMQSQTAICLPLIGHQSQHNISGVGGAGYDVRWDTVNSHRHRAAFRSGDASINSNVKLAQVRVQDTRGWRSGIIWIWLNISDALYFYHTSVGYSPKHYQIHIPYRRTGLDIPLLSSGYLFGLLKPFHSQDIYLVWRSS